MGEDWKEKLNALKESGTIKEEETEELASEKEENLNIANKGQKERLSVIIDRKGRKGKSATIIEGFTVEENEVKEIAKTIKQKLGKGGSVRDSEILIQGECKDEVIHILENMGFKVK